jgi:hypothetical protein
VALALVTSTALLVGCQRSGRQDAAAARQVSARSIAADYAACQERAAGDARRLVACADAAVVTSVPGSAAPAVATLGDAANAQAGDSLSHQAAVADALAKLAIELARLREGTPLAAAGEHAVPAQLAQAAAPILASACVGARDARTCLVGRDRLLPRLSARLASISTAPDLGSKAAPLGGYGAPGCAAVRAAATPEVALAEFESEFPAALKDVRLVETIRLDDARIREISAYLACLAERTDYAPDVIDSSLAFFASRQSGPRARAALERLGEGTGSDAAAAREFSRQVSDYLSAPDG